jgi:hypothetical protein
VSKAICTATVSAGLVVSLWAIWVVRVPALPWFPELSEARVFWVLVFLVWVAGILFTITWTAAVIWAISDKICSALRKRLRGTP